MKKTFFLILLISFAGSYSPAQSVKSFKDQNRNNSYKSFSLGMGVSYSNNPSLTKFIEGDVPNYSLIPVNDRVSDFAAGFSFFGGAEFQLSRNISVKGEYSYLIKSIDVVQNTSYQYSYSNHQPILMAYYLIPDDYSFIKLGLGGGYVNSSFTRTVSSLSMDYSASGFAVKGEGIVNMQISSNLAGYIGGEIFKTFVSDLKSGDEFLLNLNGDRVNTGSFGLGARLGIEIFIF